MLFTVLAVVVFNLGGFFIGGALLHRAFHGRRRDEAPTWKHQPKKFQRREQIKTKLPLVILNGVIINSALGVALHLSLTGQTTAWLTFDGPYGVATAVATPFLCGIWYHLSLYYFHRSMHHPFLFKRFHHLHHKFKAPMFLDALYEHPFEAAYGGFVISFPLLIAPAWIPGWLLFVAVVGLHEILDHSGINLNVPGLSDSWDHDEHHRKFHNGYGQLLPTLDMLHGTSSVRLEDHDRQSAAVG